MGRTKELLGDMYPRRTLQELLDEVEMLRQHDLKIAEEVAAREQELENDNPWVEHDGMKYNPESPKETLQFTDSKEEEQ